MMCQPCWVSLNRKITINLEVSYEMRISWSPLWLNSLTPGRFDSHPELVIFKFISSILWNYLQVNAHIRRHYKGILPIGPYLPCISMTGRALLAGYHQLMISQHWFRLWPGTIWFRPHQVKCIMSRKHHSKWLPSSCPSGQSAQRIGNLTPIFLFFFFFL